jgi:hypothetical protein
MALQDFVLASGLNSYGDTDKYYIIAGVIRNTGSGFQFINDSDHGPLNMVVGTVITGPVGVIINFEPGTKILTFLVGPDETYAIQNITCGASVNFDNALIRFGNSAGAIDPQTLTNPSGNFWIFGILRK